MSFLPYIPSFDFPTISRQNLLSYEEKTARPFYINIRHMLYASNEETLHQTNQKQLPIIPPNSLFSCLSPTIL